MPRKALYGIVAGVVAGALVGYLLGYERGIDAAARVRQWEQGAAAPAPAPGTAAGSPAPLPTESLQRIEVNRRLVAQNPRDRQAWVHLGNDYFDTHQREKAIAAYAEALKLGPDDPDVLTDQGVMYRETGAFDLAIANFERASRIDPRHAQSLYNLGVVQRYDKHDPEKAAAAWRKVIEVAPASPQAAQARQALAEIGPAGLRR